MTQLFPARVHATANHSVIRARSLAPSPLPQHAHSGYVSLAHFSVSAPSPFLLLSIIALIWKLRHRYRLTHRSLPCGVTPASLAHTPGFRGSCRNPSFTLKLRLDSFTLLLLAAQGLCPPHREKAGLPGLATMTLVQILDFLLYTLVTLNCTLFPISHAIIFFPEFCNTLRSQGTPLGYYKTCYRVSH